MDMATWGVAEVARHGRCLPYCPQTKELKLFHSLLSRKAS